MRAPMPVPTGLVALVGGRFFYGWLVLFAAAVCLFASGAGQSFNFSLYVDPIAADLAVGTTAVASAYGLATLVAAFALPAVGRMVDRYGARRVLAAVSLALGAACIAFSQVTDLVTLTLGFGLLRFLAQGSLMLICANLVAQWFSRRRGLATSLMMLGFCASLALYPPLGAQMMSDGGDDPGAWRDAWVWLGVLSWALLLPVALLIVRGRPEEVGLLPDGDRSLAADAAAGSGPSQPDDGATLGQALRSPAFYIIASGLFSMSMLSTALHFFQVSVFTSQGLDPETAALVFTVVAVAMAVAMPLVGRTVDLLDPRLALMAALGLQSASLAAAAFVDSLPTALVYAVLFGLTNASSMVIGAYVWPRYFGRRHIGSIMGTAQTAGVVGASLGPLPLGAGFDLFGSYSETLLLLALLPAVAGAAAVFLRRPPAAL